MDELKRRCEELRRESARLKGELAARKRANRPLQEQLALKKAQLRKALTAVETLKKLRAHLEASAPGEGPGGYGDMGEGGGGGVGGRRLRRRRETLFSRTIPMALRSAFECERKYVTLY